MGKWRIVEGSRQEKEKRRRGRMAMRSEGDWKEGEGEKV